MIKYRTLHASPLESNAEGTPQTTWTAADDLPPQQLKTHLCSMGFHSDGTACTNCESQCAFGRRYLKLSEIIPENVGNASKAVRAYKDGKLVGEYSSQARAEIALGFVSRGCVCKAMKFGRPFMGYTFRRVM